MEHSSSASSVSSEEKPETTELIEMKPLGELHNPRQHASTVSMISKYDQLRTRIREARRAMNKEEEHGASVQLKNVSFEVVLPEAAEAQTLGDVISPVRIVRNFITRIKEIPKKKDLVHKRKILDDISFSVRPKTMTLLLGAPGSGKTTLMKLIANQQAPGKATGEFLINGSVPDQKFHHHFVAYCDQHDVHLPSYKVLETEEFASLLLSSPLQDDKTKKMKASNILSLLGLDHRKETIVGDDYIRGLSGGEKRRMTIAVALAKDTELLLLDEPTTGLDATTSLELFKFCKVVAEEAVPIIASPLQPSSDIFFMFDNLILMSHGKIVYTGPIQEVLPFFAKHGFVCPRTKNPADFLLEVVDKLELEEDKKSISRLSKSFDTVDGNPESLYQPLQAEDKKKIYNTSLGTQVKMIVKRGFAMQRNHPQPTIFRYIKTLLVALVYGSAYWQLGSTQADLQSRAALGFAVILYAGFSSTANLGPMFEQRSVFYMQTRNGYFSPLAFFIGTLIVDTPIALCESLLYGTIVYWMAGLKATVDAYIYFSAVVFMMSFLILSLVRFLAYAMPDLVSASSLAPLFMIFQLLFAGFVISKEHCWDGLSWLFYISPFFYGNKAITINELSGEEFKCTNSELLPPPTADKFYWPIFLGGYGGHQVCPFTTGEQYLAALDFDTDKIYKVWWFLALSAFFIAFQLLALRAILKNYYPPPAPREISVSKDAASDLEEECTANGEGYMSWRDLNYSVFVKPKFYSLKAKEIKLLNNVDGFVKPGMMLALMGPSGAGKSTLLDVLARRKTGGKINGKILVNGKPVDMDTFPHLIGYVEQQNLHILSVTVREAVEFSAMLRLSEKFTRQQKFKHVKWVLKSLELDVIRDSILWELSFEQLKRVTIAVELAADPAILFLDEPTSGLDARAAALVMKCVKRVAEVSGKAVICTIHQPAEEVFRLFSDLLLLKKGGDCVYFGPIGTDYSSLLHYFDKELGLTLRELQNPADFVLDVCTQQDPEPAAVYKNSFLYPETTRAIDEGIVPSDFKAPPKPDYYAAPIPVQFVYLIQRALTHWWRQPNIVKGGNFAMLMFGTIMGLMFLNIPNDQTGVKEKASLIYFGVLLASVGMSYVTPLIIGQRPTYTREQAANAYRPGLYILGLFFSGLPFSLLNLICIAIPFYYIGGLRSEPQYFFFFLLVSLENVLIFLCMNMICAVWFPTNDIATAMSSTFTSLFTLFSGFMIRFEQIPNYWIWFYYVSPMHYVLEALVINEYAGQKFKCPNNEGAVFIGVPAFGVGTYYCPTTEGDQVIDSFGFIEDRMWVNVGILAGMLVGYLFIVIFGVRYIKHIQR